MDAILGRLRLLLCVGLPLIFGALALNSYLDKLSTGRALETNRQLLLRALEKCESDRSSSYCEAIPSTKSNIQVLALEQTQHETSAVFFGTAAAVTPLLALIALALLRWVIAGSSRSPK